MLCHSFQICFHLFPWVNTRFRPILTSESHHPCSTGRVGFLKPNRTEYNTEMPLLLPFSCTGNTLQDICPLLQLFKRVSILFKNFARFLWPKSIQTLQMSHSHQHNILLSRPIQATPCQCSRLTDAGAALPSSALKSYTCFCPDFTGSVCKYGHHLPSTRFALPSLLPLVFIILLPCLLELVGFGHCVTLGIALRGSPIFYACAGGIPWHFL